MARNNNNSNAIYLTRAPLATVAPWSLSMWILTTDVTVDQFVFVIRNAGNTEYWRLGILGATGSGAFRYYATSSGTAVCNAGITATANTWYKVTIVEGSSTDHRIYVNGGNKGTNATSKAPASVTEFALLSHPGGNAFKGLMGPVTFWNNYALTDQEVSDDYDGHIVGVTSRVDWNLDGRGSAAETDITRTYPFTVTGTLLTDNSLDNPMPLVYQDDLNLDYSHNARFGYGASSSSTTVSKASVITWCNDQGTVVAAPPPPPTQTVMRRQDALRWFDPTMTIAQMSTALTGTFNPYHGWQANSPAPNQGQATGQGGGKFITGSANPTAIVDTAGNKIIEMTALNGNQVFKHKITKAGPTWFNGNTTSRSRLLTGEIDQTGVGPILRNSKTYWVGYSFLISSESSTGTNTPWPPGIRQLVLDWKQPTAAASANQSPFNSQPRLELMEDGRIHFQRLNLNAGQTVIADDGSNCTAAELWIQQLLQDTWYNFICQFRLAGRASNGPVINAWFAKDGDALAKVINNDTNPNSYEFTQWPFTFLMGGIYDWDVNRGTWVNQTMYSGRMLVFTDGIGTPAPDQNTIYNTLKIIRGL